MGLNIANHIQGDLNFNLFVVNRHEVHSINTHTLLNAGW